MQSSSAMAQQTPSQFSKSTSSHSRPVSSYQQNGASGQRAIHPPPPPPLAECPERSARPHSTAFVGATTAIGSGSTSGASSSYQSSSTSPESTWARSNALTVASAAPQRVSHSAQPHMSPLSSACPMSLAGGTQANRLTSNGLIAGANQFNPRVQSPMSAHSGSEYCTSTMSQAERSLQHLALMNAVMQSTPDRSTSSTVRSAQADVSSSTQQTSLQSRVPPVAEVRRGIVGRMAAVLASHAPPPDEAVDV